MLASPLGQHRCCMLTFFLADVLFRELADPDTNTVTQSIFAACFAGCTGSQVDDILASLECILSPKYSGFADAREHSQLELNFDQFTHWYPSLFCRSSCAGCAVCATASRTRRSVAVCAGVLSCLQNSQRLISEMVSLWPFHLPRLSKETSMLMIAPYADIASRQSAMPRLERWHTFAAADHLSAPMSILHVQIMLQPHIQNISNLRFPHNYHTAVLGCRCSADGVQLHLS